MKCPQMICLTREMSIGRNVPHYRISDAAWLLGLRKEGIEYDREKNATLNRLGNKNIENYAPDSFIIVVEGVRTLNGLFDDEIPRQDITTFRPFNEL